MSGKPMKIVLERRVRPGARQAFDQWLKELMAAAARSPELEGSSVFTAGEDEHFILLRFASQAAYDQWQALPETVELLRRGDTHATSRGEASVQCGMETWFTVPGRPTPPAPPPRWKMALVTWLALLPQALLLSVVIPSGLPFLVRVSISTALPVAMLTWVFMPNLTRLLYGWLYPSAKPVPVLEERSGADAR